MTDIRKTILFLCILFLSVNSDLYCQSEARWVRCTGEAAIKNISYEEAEVIAKRRARLDAIEQVCGVQLQAETLVKDFITAGDFIHSISYGDVIEERDIHWSTENITPENPTDPPVIILKLQMMAKVKPMEQKPDPTFKVKLKLNQSSYASGDEVIFDIQSTKDCYLYIINLAANDSVYVLYPNTYHTSNYIQSLKTLIFPVKSDRESGFHIRVSTLPGHKEDAEIVKVIAIKHNVDLLFGMEISRGFGLMGTPKMAMTQLARQLSEIPVSERAEATIMYTVYSRGE